MTKTKVALSLEDQHGSAYLELRDGEVLRTEEIQNNVLVDYGAQDEVVGIEFLFHAFSTAEVSMFRGRGFSESDIKILEQFFTSKCSKFQSTAAGVWNIPVTHFRSEAQRKVA